jgi:hypothetical protein
MPETIPFGKAKGSSVEQLVIQDYKYFDWFYRTIDIKKTSLRQRFEYVYHKANNFQSVEPCVQCPQPAALVSIYNNSYMRFRGSSMGYIYCSSECFNDDSQVTADLRKITLSPMKFDTALSSTKFDTNELVALMAKCMGINEGRKTKEYLEDFFNRLKTV